MVTILYVSDPWVVHYNFDAAQGHANWWADVTRIKDEIRAINNDGDAANRAPSHRRWLARITQFVAQHGEGYLPPDVKVAVNDVQRNIGEDVTVWQQPVVYPAHQ